MQAIYQWLMNVSPIDEIKQQYLDDPESQSVDQALMSELIIGATSHYDALSLMLTPCLDRPLDAVDPVERAILLLAGYELQHLPQTPYRVVINESIELAKGYGAEQGYKFVNGVLDRLATRLERVKSP